MWLFLIFVAVPLVEIALFIQVGGWIGLWPTLAVVILTALAGAILVRAQGIGTLRRLQASLDEGRDPVDPIAHGAMILVAGVLLVTPGFFTDAVGLALLLAPVRVALIRWGASRITVIAAGRAHRPGRHAPPRPDTVSADYELVEETEPREPPGPADPPRRGNGRADRPTSQWTRPPR